MENQQREAKNKYAGHGKHEYNFCTNINAANGLKNATHYLGSI
jgi:hypothetical protein